MPRETRISRLGSGPEAEATGLAVESSKGRPEDIPVVDILPASQSSTDGRAHSEDDLVSRVADLPAPSEEASNSAGSTTAAPIPLFALGPWLWGTLGVVFAILLVATGLPLLLFYSPTLAEARLSLIDLSEATAFGFFRDLHYWAAQGLLISAFLHLLRIFALGSYRRVLGWSATVGLVLLSVLAAWSGSLLPEPRAGDPVLLLWLAHCVVLPGLGGLVVVYWWRRRGVRR